jgi:hypothetical protein
LPTKLDEAGGGLSDAGQFRRQKTERVGKWHAGPSLPARDRDFRYGLQRISGTAKAKPCLLLQPCVVARARGLYW